jgi:hypothetical protein
LAHPVSQEPTGGVSLIPASSASRTIGEIVSALTADLACLFDANNLDVLLDAVSSSEQKILELRGKGVRFRCVTEMSESNLARCKELMANFELYHAPCLAGSFLVADGSKYLGFLGDDAGRMIRITSVSFVKGQTFLINNIIERAVPAKQRIVEIAKGVGDEFIETIRDPARTKTLLLELITSAVYEISILFSTRNSFMIAEREGILDELGRVSKLGVKVKILVMRDEMVIKEISDLKLKASYDDVHVNYLQQFLPTKITTVIMDQSKCMTIEVKDDTKETFQDSIGLSTYSNSESTVFSNTSIFDSLWIQSELDKQNKARQAYFQLFKGFRLKEEVYDRHWSSDAKRDNASEDQ